jgi:NAD(P)-dependent dehydrogenase (short-subunit alcohol dehydrogenase family)
MSMNGWNWVEDVVPRIDGKTVIVTGAASGLGAHIAKSLSIKGANVVLADIDINNANLVAGAIRSSVPGSSPKVLEVDLGDFRSIENFARSFRLEHNALHLLVNNAGIMTPPYEKTEQGHESQWGVNHLGHFVLTAYLFEMLTNTKGSRVITQSSIVHRGGNIDFNDINSERSYSPWKAYKQSKLAMLLFSQELQRKMDQLGIKSPMSVACHPGLVDTPLYRHGRAMRLGLKPFMHSINEGVKPALRAALDPEVRGGQFYGPDGWMEFKGRPVLVKPHKRGRDISLAKRVWELSENMTGEMLASRLEKATGGCNIL